MVTYNSMKLKISKTILSVGILVPAVIVFVLQQGSKDAASSLKPSTPMAAAHNEYKYARQINGLLKPGESFNEIFKRNGLSIIELIEIDRASRGSHGISHLTPGKPYSIRLSADSSVLYMTYEADEDHVLHVIKAEPGYLATLVPIDFEIREHIASGTIADNLFNAMDSAYLTMELADIFAYDMDFTSDIRKGDSFKVIAEKVYRDENFVRFGKVLYAEFTNEGQEYQAYRFERDGRTGYYDKSGASLTRSMLKAPLNYRRISSGFTNKRFHPVLKVYRPHHGVDYVASTGTPVVSVGDGRVEFAGRKGPNGNLVVIKHPNGYETFYGHLSRIDRKIKRGSKVQQGQIIGAVGSTGRSTGPHLDYRVKLRGKFVNPLRLDLPKGSPVDKALMTEFLALVEKMDGKLSSAYASRTSPSAADKTDN